MSGNQTPVQHTLTLEHRIELHFVMWKESSESACAQWADLFAFNPVRALDNSDGAYRAAANAEVARAALKMFKHIGEKADRDTYEVANFLEELREAMMYRVRRGGSLSTSATTNEMDRCRSHAAVEAYEAVANIVKRSTT